MQRKQQGGAKARRRSRREASTRARQTTMPFVRVARPGKKLGRPRSADSGVWHVRRGEVSSRVPMLVTMKLCAGLPSLRSREESEIFFAALRRVNRDHDVRIVHWVLLSNHMHLIVEGDDREGVRKAMQGLAISLIRRWNHLWGRSGQVFADRYHRRDLTTPTEVRNGLRYVFTNQARHTGGRPMITLRNDDGSREYVPYVDRRYSSALDFNGWQEEYIERRPPTDESAAPRSWLLRVGYRRAGGLLSASDSLPR